MKYSRYWVFLGSYGAMFFMTFVSCFLGQFILYILPEQYMKFGAAILFFIFGGKSLYDVLIKKQEEDDNEEIEKEMEELNQKLTQKTKDIEEIQTSNQKVKNQVFVVEGYIVASQTFLQIFLGEWGDKSQITTIAMSASYDPIRVFVGSVIAHALCSATAVTGGRYISSFVSEKLLTIFGGIVFIFFGIFTLYNL
ncbi:protein family UPF0016, putative [Ichthyophthirius multifiliis]|uniref:GDT1 family protein n=1 Tax=Ichthyophthirius multifiliis TaxID=5932 RepID=G0R631_ICHMU|nr:protein family UPF0016, putative [Ichthyophthirius multifiliis]EGR27097.1 protein family UPF0016, putative [Ichthyophthirius multifiliis]|eukprot:XP_004023981.1 protein family UPF0016, putative [Ichthyophthirius multifiliis]